MATAQRDYYEVLGVARDADQKTIKEAFRKLAMQYHPDRNKSPDAESRFKEIAEAYGILSDPQKRANYDAGGFAGVEGFTPEDIFGGIDFGEIFRGTGFGFDFGNDFFGDLFGRYRKPAGVSRGADIEMRLNLPLQVINKGGEETVRYRRPVTCSVCNGSGSRPGSSPRQCDACQGSGQRVLKRQESRGHGTVSVQQISACPVCRGTGVIIDLPCERCHGSGREELEEKLKVTIPAGIEEGTALRVARHGLPSEVSNGVPGDLYVYVYSQPDPRFERHGADLWTTVTIPVPEAVLGTKLKVPTLDGAVDVKVPPGTQADEILRLRGKGLPNYASGAKGDLNIRLQLKIPEHLSDEERKLYEQLRELAKEEEVKKRWWRKNS